MTPTPGRSDRAPRAPPPGAATIRGPNRTSEARLIRRWRFRASHAYRRSDWSEERNLRRFGSLARPHAHTWTVEARVVGRVDAETGFLVDLALLDSAWEGLTADWDGADLDSLLPEGTVPSAEEIARWAYLALVPSVPAPARLEMIAVWEDEDLGAEYPAASFQHPPNTGCQ